MARFVQNLSITEALNPVGEAYVTAHGASVR